MRNGYALKTAINNTIVVLIIMATKKITKTVTIEPNSATNKTKAKPAKSTKPATSVAPAANNKDSASPAPTTSSKSAPPRRNKNYLPYEAAREFIRGELIKSRGAYAVWYEREQPKILPKYPYRAYDKSWISWNDFLGTNNKFKEGRSQSWRSYREAVAFVHTLRLRSQRDWLDFCRDHPDKVPNDIPRRPDLTYDSWLSWSHWLGSKPIQAIEAKADASRAAVYYIIRYKDAPGNVMTYGVERLGMAGMRNRWDHAPFDVVKLFWFEQSKAEQIDKIVKTHSMPYLEDDTQRITPNVWSIVEMLQNLLMTAVYTIDGKITTSAPAVPASSDSYDAAEEDDSEWFNGLAL